MHFEIHLLRQQVLHQVKLDSVSLVNHLFIISISPSRKQTCFLPGETFESIDVDVSDSDSWQLIGSDDGNFSYRDVTTTDDDDNDGVVLDVDDLVQHRYVSQSSNISMQCQLKNAYEIDHSHRTIYLDLDDELVPKWLNNKFERRRMRKLGKKVFYNISSSPLLQTRSDDSVHKVVKNFERCFRCQVELDWLWYGIPSSGFFSTCCVKNAEEAEQKDQPNLGQAHHLISDSLGSRVVYLPQGHSEQDFTQQPPAQELIARDLHDNEWKFRHIFCGMLAT
ncbi:hypothetical protein QVD17_08503 [Tagetes erecta]|uniref:Uncharacterized protein n=1 Tax=Tagetes erecta TaxID=13708 RepID=A0AAD8L5V7_TARER|nr:hypothetical protein QVD17_08503 [Tagetes erecta]